MMELVDEAEFASGAAGCAARPTGRRNPRPPISTCAAIRPFEQPGDMQQCRFAGARRADQRHDLAGIERQIDAVQHDNLAAAASEDAAHPAQLQRRRNRSGSIGPFSLSPAEERLRVRGGSARPAAASPSSPFPLPSAEREGFSREPSLRKSTIIHSAAPRPGRAAPRAMTGRASRETTTRAPCPTTAPTSSGSIRAGYPGKEIDLGREQIDPDDILHELADRFDVSGKGDAQVPSPARVPTTPMLAPDSMKMRRIMPREAPIVRRIAMSRPLSFTIMIMLEMMLKAATTMISVRIRNMTLRSISTALNEARIGLLPVDDADMAAESGRDRPGLLLHLVGIGDEDFEIAGAVRARGKKSAPRRAAHK